MLVFNRLNENMNSLCISNEWNIANMMCYERLFHDLIFAIVDFYANKSQPNFLISMMWA
jgi:hypothetical protein